MTQKRSDDWLGKPMSPYLHFDIVSRQSAKKPHAVCGDVVCIERTPDVTWLVLADGIGSGPHANLAATMCASRLVTLLKERYTMREAFASLVETMAQWREPGQPFAAFAVARLMPNGEARVLTYEAPPPLLIARYGATVLEQQQFEHDGARIGEARYTMAPGDALLLMSDGITQAGLGMTFPEGWGSEGVRWYVTEALAKKTPVLDLADNVHNEARRYWKTTAGDDCTTVAIQCREGASVTVLTGPPSSRTKDEAVLSHFLAQEGKKVVCGGTTALVVGRFLGVPVQVKDESLETIAPPFYHVEGIDLVTEGAVTLNQAFNLLDVPEDQLEERSGASALSLLLRQADRIQFIVGGAENVSASGVVYRQQGILPRAKIVKLLARALQDHGKTVSVRFA